MPLPTPVATPMFVWRLFSVNSLEVVLGRRGDVFRHRHVLCGRVVTRGAVPRVVAARPRDFAPERGEHVVERPGDHHVVVGAEQEGYDDSGQTGTWRCTQITPCTVKQAITRGGTVIR